MLGSLNALLAATVAFVGGHFLLSSAPLRTPLVKTFGPGGFTPLYALLVGAAFVWMLTAYGAAPAVVLWYPPPALRWVPLLVMPFALFLAVAGLTTPSPTLVGGENVVARAAGTPHRLVGGIFTVTRHPFLWGTTLWAVSHLLANGTVADVILMGGILVLSLAGMRHIDRRREAALGGDWGPIRLTTSLVPFAAAIEGRTKFDWRGIGWWRPVVALLLYGALLHFHELIAGVPVLPA